MPGSEPHVVLRVLGMTRLGDGPPRLISSARQRRILAVLAAAGGHPVRTDVLVDAVWGESLPTHPDAALQTQLTRLRRALGDRASALTGSGGSYHLALDRAEVDAWWFEDVLSTWRADGVVEPLRTALGWWNGEPFADAADHPAVQPAAVRLNELRHDAIEALADAELAAGRPDESLRLVEPVLIEDPYRDRAHAARLRALCAAGRATEALHRYQEHRRRLAEELGLEPSPLLAGIERDILRHELPTADGQGALPPLPVTSFHGRSDELRTIVDLTGRHRVVTIVGPGGAGKSRLALHAAHQLHDRYRDGVWWCDLQSVRPGETAAAIAASLGVHDRAGQTAVERLVTYLAERQSVIVTDNCEHVTADMRAIVENVVRRTAHACVLATSRQPLGVDGEHRLRLGPLRAAPGDGTASPALDLFVDRARAVAPGFHADDVVRGAIVELCALLGDLPLAIELAAGSITRIDVRSLTERIRDQPWLLDRSGPTDRHRSLADVIEATYRLLPSDERRLADRLAVFAGPFTLDHVERLGTGSGEPGRVGATLGALVDKSIVLFRPNDHRYELLPPVQAVFRAHLQDGDGLEALRRRHAHVMVDDAARIDAALRGPDEVRVARAFDDVITELRTARATLEAAGDTTGLLELSAAAHWFSALRTRSELYRWAEDAVGRDSVAVRAPGADRAWASAANGAAKRGDLVRALALAERGRALLGDEARYVVETLAQVHLFEGDLDAAIAASRRAAERHAEAGDRLFSIDAAGVEAAALAYRGDRRDAEVLARRLHREAATIGVASELAMTSYILAETLTDPSAAAGLYEQALVEAAASGADFVTGLALTSLAALELRNDRQAEARRRLSTVLDHWERGGIWNQQWLAIRLVIDALDRGGAYEGVATLAGAYEASSRAGPAYGDDARRLAGALERARRELGGDGYEAAHRRGLTLSDAQAAAYAKHPLGVAR